MNTTDMGGADFDFELDHLQAAWIVTKHRLTELLGARGLGVSGDRLALFALDLSEDLDGELPRQLERALRRVRDRGPRSEGQSTPDAATLRAMAYSMPALAAAMAAGRDPGHPLLLDDVLDVLWRTALWRLGRGLRGELGGPECRPGSPLQVSDGVRRRIIVAWIERMHRMARIESRLGVCMVRGLDYFGMSLIGAVAARTFDDQRFTREEAREVAVQAFDFRLALASALVWVVRADERQDGPEEHALHDLLDRLGFTPAETVLVLQECRGGPSGPGRNLLNLIERPADRRYILDRAREMAQLDRVETPHERLVLERIADLLSLPLPAGAGLEATPDVSV